MAALHCSCGYLLTYETDICPACLPNGLTTTPPAPRGLRYIADFLGLTHVTEGAITRRIDEIVSERNRYEEVELEYCEGEETLRQCIERHRSLAERSFEDGYRSGLETAIRAIQHEKEERQAYHAWDGMKRAAAAIEEVRDGTFVWAEEADAGRNAMVTPEGKP